MYNKSDKLIMIIGSVGLVFVLAFANVNQGQSQDIVTEIGSKQIEVVQGFAYKEEPLIIQKMQVPKEHLTLEVGKQYPLDITGIFDDHKEMNLSNHPAMVYTYSNEALAVVEDGHIQIADTGITGDYVTITCTYQHISIDIHILIKQSLEDTVELDEDGHKIITNYTAIDTLVNKERSLPCDYVPEDLVEPSVPFSFNGQDEKRNMRSIAAEALEKMFAAAKKDEIILAASSGYRSYKRQTSLHNYKINKFGREATKRISAIPGHSEHQTGLAMDITCRSVGLKLRVDFGKKPEGIWIKENAHLYGFIIRYPEGKEQVTGYSYEPWHVRYLGITLAKLVYESGLTYEDYLKQKD